MDTLSIRAPTAPTMFTGDWKLPGWSGGPQRLGCCCAAAGAAAARRSRGTTIFARMMRPRGTGWRMNSGKVEDKLIVQALCRYNLLHAESRNALSAPHAEARSRGEAGWFSL